MIDITKQATKDAPVPLLSNVPGIGNIPENADTSNTDPAKISITNISSKVLSSPSETETEHEKDQKVNKCYDKLAKAGEYMMYGLNAMFWPLWTTLIRPGIEILVESSAYAATKAALDIATNLSSGKKNDIAEKVADGAEAGFNAVANKFEEDHGHGDKKDQEETHGKNSLLGATSSTGDD
ncbi:MAG: hypothetical protein SFT93_03325 [Rickettsiaceae bacterium]|nr:hypothetical protein [Rickettsiaceae bacterium]